MKLIEKLNLIKGSLSNQEIVPILSSFCFTGKEIYAFDGIQASVIKHQSELKCGLPAQLLLKLLTGYKDSILKFEISKNSVAIKSGRSKTKLSSLGEDLFVYGTDKLIEVSGGTFDITDDFILGLKKCMVSVSDKEYSQQVGVTIETKGTSTRLYSTNNTSISRYILKEGFVGDEDFRSFIPLKLCEQIILWAGVFKKSEKKVIVFGRDCISVSFDEGSLYTKLNPSLEFLDFEEILDSITDNSDIFEVPSELDTILNRCILMSNDDPIVDISCSEDEMSLKASGKYGNVNESIRLECELDDRDFRVDTNLFKSMLPIVTELSIAKIGDTVVLQGSDKNYINLLMSSTL
jgi:DNA polymerase III sliding clamp (beta) subunit (PCNA family)